MRVAVIGGGYVGLVSGTCLAEIGHTVIIVESDSRKLGILRTGGVPIHEPGLGNLMAANRNVGRLSFTDDLTGSLTGVDVALICVGTPPLPSGAADLSHILAAVEAVALAADGPLVVATKSTVPVGTGSKLREIVGRLREDINVEIASNPEFLREGDAIKDFLHPDRIVVGGSKRACAILKELYAPLLEGEGCPFHAVSLETSELTKYASNAFLAAKLAFINEMADLCERTGADVEQLAVAMGDDRRISPHFLSVGPGYGGSCFPKDTLAVVHSAHEHGLSLSLVEATVASNNRRKIQMAARVIDLMRGTPGTVAVMGLAFKAGTDDMRDSPAVDMVKGLRAAGMIVRAFDPEACETAKEVLGEVGITFCVSPSDCMAGCDAVVVMTEWDDFRSLSPSEIAQAMAGDLVVDLRNIWNPVAMRAAGLRYHSVGRG